MGPRSDLGSGPNNALRIDRSVIQGRLSNNADAIGLLLADGEQFARLEPYFPIINVRHRGSTAVG